MIRCTTRFLLTGLCLALVAAPCFAAAGADDAKKLAREAIGKQNYAKAIDLLTQQLKTTRDDPDLFFLRGLSYFQKGNFEKSIADMDEAIGLDPAYFGYYRMRGRIYAARRDYDKALANFDFAIELEPKEASSYLDRGFIHAFRKDYDKALADYNECIRLAPKSPQAYYWRGSLHLLKGEHTKAVDDFTKALAIDPKLPEAHLGRGNALMKLKDYAKAIADFRTSIKMAPQDDLGYNNLAWLLATNPDTKLRDGRKAVEYANKACALTGHRRPSYLDTLAASYAEMGDFKAAVRWQERAIRALSGQPTQAEGQVDDYRDRLALYQQGKAYRLK
jgi:tetratricopeptide (TPR) repeat protein